MQKITVRADQVRPGDITVDLPCEMDYTVRTVGRAPVVEVTPADVAAAGGWVVLTGDTEGGYYRDLYEDDQSYHAAPDEMLTVLRTVDPADVAEMPRLTASGLRVMLDAMHWIARCGGYYFLSGKEISAAKKLERDGLLDRSPSQSRCIKLSALGQEWARLLSLAETAVGNYCTTANSLTAPTGIRVDAKLHAAAAVRLVFSHLSQDKAELVVIQAHNTQHDIVRVVRNSGYIR